MTEEKYCFNCQKLRSAVVAMTMAHETLQQHSGRYVLAEVWTCPVCGHGFVGKRQPLPLLDERGNRDPRQKDAFGRA